MNKVRPKHLQIEFDKHRWTNETPRGDGTQCPVQDDTGNGGFHIISYMIHCLTGNDFFKPSEIKQCLQYQILAFSDYMLEVCLYCGAHCYESYDYNRKNKPIEWVECVTCYRWVHYFCIPIPKLAFARIEKENKPYTCLLCDSKMITGGSVVLLQMNDTLQPKESSTSDSFETIEISCEMVD